MSVFANSGLNNPEGLAFDTAGNLYVANENDNSILKYDSSGNASLFASTPSPVGLAFDKSGNLFVANYATFKITKFDSNGTRSIFADQTSGLNYPADLAFDRSGNLYVANDANSINSDVLEFNLSGQASVFATADPNTVFYVMAIQFVPEPSAAS